jgi:hypothetical protein
MLNLISKTLLFLLPPPPFSGWEALCGSQRVERLLTAQKLVTTELSLFYGTSMLITAFGKSRDGSYGSIIPLPLQTSVFCEVRTEFIISRSHGIYCCNEMQR